MAFMYKWHNLCINSGLEVGDTYFFSVIHEGIDCGDDDDEEWEHDQEDDDAKFMVEVCKKNNRFFS